MTRLEALERVAEAARRWRNAQFATEQIEAWRELCAAIDALPAPAAEPQGETVEVRAVVLATTDGANWTVIGAESWSDESAINFARDEMDSAKAENHIATIRARVPLTRVPEVVGEVE